MHEFEILKAEFGTLGRLAELLEIGPSAVYNWVDRGHIPVKHMAKIRELSEGRVTKEMLRPDLFKKD
jgi:DNA-binding transcriptional regulator YdaS (Cro superfamily)